MAESARETLGPITHNYTKGTLPRLGVLLRHVPNEVVSECTTAVVKRVIQPAMISWSNTQERLCVLQPLGTNVHTIFVNLRPFWWWRWYQLRT